MWRLKLKLPVWLWAVVWGGWGSAGAGAGLVLGWRYGAYLMLHAACCVPYDERGEFWLGMGLAMTKGSIEPFLELVLLGLIVNC